jgi:hypothetical protein
MSASPRVAFQEGSRLFAADLTAEQEYRLGLMGRHILAAHDWGVVSQLDPSYAIDGYGRELIQWNRRAPTAAEPNVWVYYCEWPLQPERPCEGALVTRTEQRALAVVNPKSDLDPEQAEDESIERILNGRAAGVLADARLWPVAVVPDADVHYTSLNAASIAGVQGKARMQIGAKGSADPFWFVLWQNPDTRRFATDRKNAWFWGDLLVSGAQKVALFGLSTGKFVRIQERIPGAESELRNAIRESSTPGRRIKLVESGGAFKITPENMWNKFAADFDVQEVDIPGLIETESDFKDTGATLLVGRALLLAPSATPPTIVAQRQITVVRPKEPPDPIAVQVQCGARQDSDFSTRFSVSGSFLSERIAGLSVTGEGGVRIGGVNAAVGDPPELLFVNGTLELPPVKASILDPLFNPLLVLAYIAGLRRANSFGELWLSGLIVPPKHVGAGEDFNYSLELTPHIFQAIKTTRLLERFRLEDGTSLQADRPESPTVITHPKQVENLPVTNFSFGRPGERFRVEMEMAIKVGDTQSSVLVPASDLIMIEEPPVLEVEVDSTPDDFVPLGKAWDHTVKTENRPTSQLLMQRLSVVDGVNNFPPTDVSTVAPEKNFNYPALDDSRDVDIEATLDYQWEGNSAASTPKKIKKTVHVGGVSVEVIPALVPGQNQNFQLKLTNISGAKITNIRNLEVEVKDSANNVLSSISQNPHLDLLDTESETIPTVAQAIDLTGQAAGNQLTLTVAYGLTRKSTAYAHQAHTIVIAL